MEYTVRFSLKPNQAEELRSWLKENHEALDATAPEGWRYLGTYFCVRAFGDFDCETRWELDGYAALDNSTPEGQRLVRDWLDRFVHDGRPMQAVLLKSVDEVVIAR